MTDGASLSCVTAATNVYDNVELVYSTCSYKWLTNNYLQGLKTEVLIDISLIDCDLASARYKIYSSN